VPSRREGDDLPPPGSRRAAGVPSLRTRRT
jgi:hypothetical protein